MQIFRLISITSINIKNDGYSKQYYYYIIYRNKFNNNLVIIICSSFIPKYQVITNCRRDSPTEITEAGIRRWI